MTAAKMRFLQYAPNLFRGSRPENQTHVNDLKAQGIKTVISFQNNFFEDTEIDDESFWVAKAQLTFVHRSMSMILPPSHADIIYAVAQIEAALKHGPVFVHCHDGVDRTGCVLWAYDVLLKLRTSQAAVDLMLAYGFHIGRYFWWLPFVERTIRHLEWEYYGDPCKVRPSA